jgi:hypothetical protein
MKFREFTREYFRQIVYSGAGLIPCLLGVIFATMRRHPELGAKEVILEIVVRAGSYLLMVVLIVALVSVPIFTYRRSKYRKIN